MGGGAGGGIEQIFRYQIQFGDTNNVRYFYLVKISELVIVSLHHQLCLAAELGHPEGPHHVLV